jgi:putative membrane protein
MNQPMRNLPRPAADSAARTAQVTHWLALGLFAASFALVMLALWLPIQLPGESGWPDAALVLLATATTLVSLSRRLPAQNVALAAAGIAFIGGTAHGIGAMTAIPFGPFSYTGNAGPRIFGTLAWPVPLIWVIAILNSRGVARLILRPWRKLRAYGFWVIGLTAALTVMFDFSLEPFAAQVKRYWLWQPTRLPLAWYGAPLVNFLGWLLAALLILAFVTPTLIDKRQRPAKRPPDYHPLAVWLPAQALFAAGTLAHGFGPAAGFDVVASVVVATFAIRGARW